MFRVKAKINPERCASTSKWSRRALRRCLCPSRSECEMAGRDRGRSRPMSAASANGATDGSDAIVRISGVSCPTAGRRPSTTSRSICPTDLLIGLLGPDGVGKSSLLSLISGARAVQKERCMFSAATWPIPGHRARTCPRIAGAPQGLGKNLYPTLSVSENLDFFARLFGHGRQETPAAHRRS